MRRSLLSLVLLSGALTMSVVAAIPKPEHPRPDWRRDEWVNLNGTWQFTFEENGSGEDAQWQQWPETKVETRGILVPFPWESELSGIHEPDKRGTGWYFRSFEVPENWSEKHVWIVFGAVDFETTVWVNGHEVGRHIGGYTPFEFDITDLCHRGEENHLVVRAFDPLDRSQPSGKQTGWYTPTSGIWQTVYLEARDKIWIKHAAITANTKAGTVSWKLEIAGDLNEPLLLEVIPEEDPEGVRPALTFGGPLTFQVENNNMNFTFKVKSPRLWTPENPDLYFCRLNLESQSKLLDTVHTYFGLRSITRETLKNKTYEYVHLNGQPIYLIGALDQSFNPKGVYTFPDDRATKLDVEKALDFGFNFLRIHIKIEEPRFYYWADRLGLLIQQDMPNFSRYDEKAKQYFTDMLDAAVARDMNHPCIFSWVLFNETWGLEKHKTKEGQQWVKGLVRHTKELDPTRLVEDNSPCRYDHVLTDINSWHFYIYNFQKARDHIQEVVDRTYPGSSFNYIGGNVQGTEPLMNSEYGGVSAGMGDRDISWCLHYLTTELRRHEKICGYIYTELQDIEWEHNGMMNYDRSPKEFGYEELIPVPDGQRPFSYRDINNPDLVGMDMVPLEARQPGETINVDTWISRFSGKGGETLLVSWRLVGVDKYGETWSTAGLRTRTSAPHQAVSPLAQLTIGPLPEEPMLYVLCVVVEDSERSLIARNFATFHTLTHPAPRKEISGNRCVLRWKPGDTYRELWDNKLEKFEDGGKIFAEGAGRVEYQVEIPKEVLAAEPENITLLTEIGARAGTAKIDWKKRTKPGDYPQTEPDKKYPTVVTVVANGVTVDTCFIQDDPADIRGLLSNLSGRHPSAYGFLQSVSLTPAQVSDVFNKAKETGNIIVAFQVKENAAHKGGISIYGEREGRYPVDPTLIIETKESIK